MVSAKKDETTYWQRQNEVDEMRLVEKIMKNELRPMCLDVLGRIFSSVIIKENLFEHLEAKKNKG